MITSPIERRLITEPEQQVVRDTVEVRAKVWSTAKINDAALQVDDGPAQSMVSTNSAFVWSCQWDSREISNGEHQLTVEIRGGQGNSDRDSITVWVNQDGWYPKPSYARRCRKCYRPISIKRDSRDPVGAEQERQEMVIRPESQSGLHLELRDQPQ